MPLLVLMTLLLITNNNLQANDLCKTELQCMSFLLAFLVSLPLYTYPVYSSILLIVVLLAGVMNVIYNYILFPINAISFDSLLSEDDWPEIYEELDAF